MFSYAREWKEYIKLKQFQKARNDFHRTIKQWGMDLEYKQPANIGYCWRMEYKGYFVEGNSETECFIEMKKVIHQVMLDETTNGVWSYD